MVSAQNCLTLDCDILGYYQLFCLLRIILRLVATNQIDHEKDKSYVAVLILLDVLKHRAVGMFHN